MHALLHLDAEALPESIGWNPPMSDDEFEAFAIANDFLQLERSKEGEILVTPATGDDTGRANAEIIRQLGNWWDSHGRGSVYNSSTGFFLPDGSNLSPDATYVLPEKLGPRSGRGPKMAHHCPDFVIELLSHSDRLPKALAKMRNWIANCAALAWLIDPYKRRFTVYTRGEAPQEILGDSGQGIGPVDGFTLNLSKVWRFYET